MSAPPSLNEVNVAAGTLSFVGSMDSRTAKLLLIEKLDSMKSPLTDAQNEVLVTDAKAEVYRKVLRPLEKAVRDSRTKRDALVAENALMLEMLVGDVDINEEQKVIKLVPFPGALKAIPISGSVGHVQQIPPASRAIAFPVVYVSSSPILDIIPDQIQAFHPWCQHKPAENGRSMHLDIFFTMSATPVFSDWSLEELRLDYYNKTMVDKAKDDTEQLALSHSPESSGAGGD